MLTSSPPGAAALLDLSTGALTERARTVRDAAFGTRVTFSPKVFLPLTRLCRDRCGYCTFATAPRSLPAPYLTPDEVLAIAGRGAEAGCAEALFTLGEAPELRYPAGQGVAHRARLRVDRRVPRGDVRARAHGDGPAAARQRRRDLRRRARVAPGGRAEPGHDDRVACGRTSPRTAARRTRPRSAGWPPWTPRVSSGSPSPPGFSSASGRTRRTGSPPCRRSPTPTAGTVTCRR